MKKLINSKHLWRIIFLLSIIVIVKIIWIAISILFLPTTGEEYKETNRVKKLYYRVRLTNESKIIAPIKPVKRSVPQVSSMRGYKLLGLYSSKEKIVVTVEKNRKTTVLVKGEDINGFVLVSAGRDYAIFKKSGEEFKLSLANSKKIIGRVKYQPKIKRPSLTTSSGNSIVDDGGVKHIPRTLLTSYTKNMDKIWKDIAIMRHQTNGKTDGYKINYVKKGSDFEKLGLKRGDILVEVNAEPLNSLSTAMNFFKEINDIENLTLTVIRNGRREDIEYEIQ